jgi:NADH-quinone oxidoreductase subunit J
MTVPFLILGVLTLAGGIATMALRNLVHCALALSVTLAGLAALYLQLDAQFVGFAQILVYVGAVAILIVFAILLTRGSEPEKESLYSSNGLLGAIVAVMVFAVIGGTILSSKTLALQQVPPPQISVRQLGDQLMTRYILPLEVLGLLLTAALIGAVIIAMQDGPAKRSGGNE